MYRRASTLRRRRATAFARDGIGGIGSPRFSCTCLHLCPVFFSVLAGSGVIIRFPFLMYRSRHTPLSPLGLDNSTTSSMRRILHDSRTTSTYLYTYVYLSAAPTYSTYVPRALPLASHHPALYGGVSLAPFFASTLFLFLCLYLYLLGVSASVRCFYDLCVENVTVSSFRDNSLPGSTLWGDVDDSPVCSQVSMR